MSLQFEWDEEKELGNIEKHGIDFDTAVKVWSRYYDRETKY